MMNKTLLVFIALFAVTIGGIGVDLYAPSLPWIAQYMNVNHALAKYTVTTFLIGFAAGQLLFGVFSDLYGRKWILVAGILIFMLSSLTAAFSPNIYILMMLRCVQGFGAASCSAVSKTLLTDSLQGNSLHKAMTSLSMAWAIGPIISPVIGGYLQHHFNWQANFYFYTAYSFVLMCVVLLLLKETLKIKVESKAAVIVAHYLDILKHRVFISGILVLGLSYSLLIAFNVMGPFLIQRTLHYGPIVFGHMALLAGLAVFSANTLARLLAKSISPIVVTKLGLLMACVFSVLYVMESYYMKTSLFTVVLASFLMIFSFGLIFPNCMSICMRLFPNTAGIASSLMGTMLYITATITSSIFSLIPLPSQVNYAWALLSVILVMALVLIFGFFPGFRGVQQSE